MNNKKVVIVDYGLGNLFSIHNACKKIGLETNITSDEYDIKNSDAVILPGVGAFNVAMSNLKNKNLIDVINYQFKSNKPILGICLGMQLFFDKSEEFGIHEGLGIIKGKVNKFPLLVNEKQTNVPNIGWSKLNLVNESRILNSINQDEYMYFVHSFYVEPDQPEIVISNTMNNGFEFCSAIEYNNVFGLQFHPEKSGEAGLRIFNNFKELI